MKLIFIAAVALVVLVFLLLSYRRFVLYFLWLFYGKFSAKYMLTFKSYFNRNPFGYCIKEDFIDRLFSFYKRKETDPVFESGQIVLPGNIAFFTSFSKVRKELGRPMCFQAYKYNDLEIKIAGFRTRAFGHNARQYYYFIDDVFFLEEIVIKKLKSEAIQTVSEDVCKNAGIAIKETPQKYFIDAPNNSTLFFRDAAFSLIISLINLEREDIKQKVDKIMADLDKLTERLGS